MITKDNILESLTTIELVNLFNEYCEDTNDHNSIIREFDEDFINETYPNAWDALQAVRFGDVDFSTKWVTLDGYENLQTLNDSDIEDLDFDSVADWLSENENIAERYGIEPAENYEEE